MWGGGLGGQGLGGQGRGGGGRGGGGSGGGAVGVKAVGTEAVEAEPWGPRPFGQRQWGGNRERMVFWDMTNISTCTIENTVGQRQMYSEYYGMCCFKGGLACNHVDGF